MTAFFINKSQWLKKRELKMEIYKNRNEKIEDRVNNLISLMTLEEKVGQTLIIYGAGANIEEQVKNDHIGSCLHTLGAACEKAQKFVAETRLQIPLLFGIDAIHGHCFWKNATIFPSQMALSCSWDTDSAEKIAEITAIEARHTGIHLTFAPQLDISRDIRWGRMSETFGEDSLLTGELAAAMIRGFQGNDLADDDSIAACAKHFVGYGETIGARDSTESEMTRRKLMSIFLPPFQRAVEAGVASVMVGYQCINGEPVSFNKFLLTDTLKKEWNWDGVLMTDWDNIGRAEREQKVTHNVKEGIIKGFNAGLDMIMAGNGDRDAAIESVKNNEISMLRLDDAVRRILTLKFRLGLFDNKAKQFPKLEKAKEVIGNCEHRKVALQAARDSCVLMTNKNNFLPLQNTPKKIAVLGPNADDIFAQLGGWSFGSPQAEFESGIHDKNTIITILEGIKNRFGNETEIIFEKACLAMNPNHKVADFFKSMQPDGYLDPVVDGLDKAEKLAEKSDLAILVLGDTQSQIGEENDRADMNLGGEQMELIERVKKTKTPFIAVLVVSKPHTIPDLARYANAIICAWNPGSEGGQAVAEIIAGDFNPSGKLTQSWPVSIGQQPVNYNQLPGWHTDNYMDLTIEPLFAFGHGLSYSNIEYKNLKIENCELHKGEAIKVSVEITNNSNKVATEIVQCYINDVVSSATTPNKELKAWQKVAISANETKIVKFEIKNEELSYINMNLERVVESGEFEIMVGSSSNDKDLLKLKLILK